MRGRADGAYRPHCTVCFLSPPPPPLSPLFLLLEEAISIPHIDLCVYMLKWSDKVHSVYLCHFRGQRSTVSSISCQFDLQGITGGVPIKPRPCLY